MSEDGAEVNMRILIRIIRMSEVYHNVESVWMQNYILMQWNVFNVYSLIQTHFRTYYRAGPDDYYL